jgi:D-lactate dehydrogenase
VRTAVFSTRPYDRDALARANAAWGHELVFLEARLSAESVGLARGFPAVCVFVNDQVDAAVIRELAAGGTKLVVTRSAGFNHIDLAAARQAGIAVGRVPAYSPHAVAEHAMALVLTLNRKTHRAFARVREGNFALQGLLGFDLHGKTVGVVGTGRIGEAFARIAHGFGCRLLAFDPAPNDAVLALGARYVSVPELLAASDVVSLHCPLTPATRHLIDDDALAQMKRGAMLINTGRGGLVDTPAVIRALKSGQLGHLGLDVYEEEEALFFEDHSEDVIQDDVLMRLLTFPNVLVTAHQGFFTSEALGNIASTTLGNVTAFETGQGTLHSV